VSDKSRLSQGSSPRLSRADSLAPYSMHQKYAPSPAMMMQRARTLLISATLFWGLTFPLVRGFELAQRARVPEISAPALACADVAARFGLAALVLLPLCLRSLANITRREWIQAVGLAFLAGIGMYLQTLGLAWADASVVGFLTQLYTLIVPLIVALRDRRLPGRRVFVACALVLVGAALLSPNLLSHFALGAGELVTLLSTLFFAGQIVWVERPLFAENRAVLVTMLMFAMLGAMFGCGYAIEGGDAVTVGRLFAPSPVWQMFLVLLFPCTIFTFLIMNAWQRWVSATEAGLIYCIEPVIAGFLPGWISRFAGVSYPNEPLTWSLLVGGMMIVGATVLVATEKRTA
jgi:drug/metabolite transporter (DMT)-like permease